MANRKQDRARRSYWILASNRTEAIKIARRRESNRDRTITDIKSAKRSNTTGASNQKGTQRNVYDVEFISRKKRNSQW